MTKKKTDFIGWLDTEIDRRGREKDVAALLDEMMIEEQLADLRRARQLSQAELAELMGVSQPLVARIEAGRVKNLTLATIARTASALGASIEFRLKPAVAMKRKSAQSGRGGSLSSSRGRQAVPAISKPVK